MMKLQKSKISFATAYADLDLDLADLDCFQLSIVFYSRQRYMLNTGPTTTGGGQSPSNVLLEFIDSIICTC